jgi:hypothetical protein
MTPLLPGAVTARLNGGGLSIYEMALTTSWEWTPRPSALPADDLLRVHIDWDVPPLGGVEPPLPSPAADFTDDVFLGGAP